MMSGENAGLAAERPVAHPDVGEDALAVFGHTRHSRPARDMFA